MLTRAIDDLAALGSSWRDGLQLRTRRWFYDVAQGFTPIVSVESRDGSFLVPTERMGRIGAQLFVRGSYAGDTIPLVLTAIREAGTVVRRAGALFDIGANIGTVAIPAVAAHGFERAVAFEAHPENARLLRLNVAYNGLTDRVLVVETALGAVDGVAAMRRVGTSGRHRVLPVGRRRTRKQRAILVDVRAARLDSLIESGEVDASDLSLVWMDVQGYEPLVLEGAPRLLENPPPIVTEFSPRHLATYGQLEAMTALVEAYFTTVVDLKSTLISGVLAVYPAARVGEIVERLEGRHTDLALLRVPPG